MILENVKINSHVGKWYQIDSKIINSVEYLLMESEIYGDEAPCIIVKADSPKIPFLENIYNGFDDLIEYFESYNITA
jgi:hypothetical protein